MVVPCKGPFDQPSHPIGGPGIWAERTNSPEIDPIDPIASEKGPASPAALGAEAQGGRLWAAGWGELMNYAFWGLSLTILFNHRSFQKPDPFSMGFRGVSRENPGKRVGKVAVEMVHTSGKGGLATMVNGLQLGLLTTPKLSRWAV